MSAAVTALNGYFLPHVNSPFTRQKFHQLQQKEGETVFQFVTGLRKVGKDFNFGANFDNQIRDLVLCKCKSDFVKHKLLEERQELTLTRGQTCRNCIGKDHFASVCKTKPKNLGAKQVQEELHVNVDQVDLLLSESVMKSTQICLSCL